MPEAAKAPSTPTTKTRARRSTPASSGKRLRLTATGKVHAAARPITADLDDADRIIWSMKNDGKVNSEVVHELKKLGVNYDPKTVGTRFLRMKNVIANNAQMVNGREWTKGEVYDSDVHADYVGLTDEIGCRLA
jgi:hypothetical protein